MEKRDYLMRQLELMTQALIGLIRRLTGMKELTEAEIETVTNVVLVENFNLTLSDILNAPTEKFTSLFAGHPGANTQNLELIADVLLINARSRVKILEKKELLLKSIDLLTWVDRAGKTFSMDRQARVSRIRDEINDL
jgi:hypothetical protein